VPAAGDRGTDRDGDTARNDEADRGASGGGPGAVPWRRGPVRVTVPATSANLGPGFDALGLALTLYDEVEVEVTERDLTIEIEGEGVEEVAKGADHLIARTMRAAFQAINDRRAAAGPLRRPTRTPAWPPGLRLRCVNKIPHGRGLGSSAAATVAGIVAARELHPDGHLLGDETAFTLATELEGHPDNVAPCLAGGLTISWRSASGIHWAGLDMVTGLEPVVFVPAQRLLTERARDLLPGSVPHADAAANAGKTGLLVAVLTGALPPDRLFDATEDRLHQHYRVPAMPESATLLDRLRTIGIPAVISGAGPAVLALATAAQADSIAAEVGNGWHIHPLNVDPHGARVQRTAP
jgi:homoserine kinase